ncbi:MAG: glycerol-3-phosphate 1-O-acyltransferase PlsY [candidate division Zixibacteria bacterium]|nr:glycerol-3-phosphate 1-O-acyltransferase PlsY [candidate division Zixibacteria bacterium]
MAVIPIILCYLLGAIPFGLIIARLYGVADIRTRGSGNIGATNVGRVIGTRAAVWVYLGDIGKGVAAVLLGRLFAANFDPGFFSYDVFLVACAVAAVLGHVFPVYVRFKGGKGVNTGLGVMITLLPYETLLAFGIFLLVVLLTRYISLGSMLAGIGLFAIVSVEKHVLGRPVADVYFYLTLVLALLIMTTHRQNISRLLTGRENRLSFHSRSGEAGSHG